MGVASAVPGDWFSANGGVLPAAPGCPAPLSASAQDPIMLKLRVRVPTNARSFRFSTRFFSAEYPEWVCSPYNDFYVVLLDSGFTGEPANPSDKNIAVYSGAGGLYPIGVNLAFGNSGLFQACLNGPTGCAGGVVGTTSHLRGPRGSRGHRLRPRQSALGRRAARMVRLEQPGGRRHGMAVDSGQRGPG